MAQLSIRPPTHRTAATLEPAQRRAWTAEAACRGIDPFRKPARLRFSTPPNRAEPSAEPGSDPLGHWPGARRSTGSSTDQRAVHRAAK